MNRTSFAASSFAIGRLTITGLTLALVSIAWSQTPPPQQNPLSNPAIDGSAVISDSDGNKYLIMKVAPTGTSNLAPYEQEIMLKWITDASYVPIDSGGVLRLSVAGDGASQVKILNASNSVITLPTEWSKDGQNNRYIRSADNSVIAPGSPLTWKVRYKVGTANANSAKLHLDYIGSSYDTTDDGEKRPTITLLPADIIDKNKNTATSLKIAKMTESGVLSGAEPSATLDIDKDPDRFYIRIKGAKNIGSVSAKVATLENSITSYNDDETEIDMQVDGNDLITKSMLLVADDVDDDHEIDNIADDAKNDRTHKAALSAKFQIKSIKIGGIEHEVDIKTLVPAEKTVNLAVVILRETAAGTPVIAQADVENDLKIAQERYAQVGIRLSWTLSINDPPSGVNLTDGSLDEFSDPRSPTAEEIALITGLGTATTDDLHVFYVNQLSSGSFGEAFLESITPSPIGENIIMSSSRRPFTLAHELGHVLKADAGHVSNIFRLMRGGGTSATNVLGASKRLSVSEQTTIAGSKHAQ